MPPAAIHCLRRPEFGSVFGRTGRARGRFLRNAELLLGRRRLGRHTRGSGVRPRPRRERLDHLPRGLVPVAGGFRHHAPHDRAQPGRGRRPQLAQVGRGRQLVLRELLGGRPAERGLPGDEREQRRPQAVNVATGVDRHVQRLLRGGEVRGPRNGTLVEPAGQIVLRVAHGPRQAHVEDLDVPVLREHQVAGLDVAVNEPLLVRVLKPRRGLHDVARGLRVVERAGLFDERFEVKPVHMFHHEEPNVLHLGNVEQAHDVGVVEGRHGAGLAVEPLQTERVVALLGGQDLERHLAVQGGVVGQVHGPHPAPAEQAQDAVRPQNQPAVSAGE